MKKYKKSIISYYDILGFSQLVENETSEEIYNILEVFNKSSRPDKELQSSKNRNTINFSDTIIKTTDIYTSFIEPLVNCILYKDFVENAYIIHDLFFSNILVRGSIIVDDVYTSKGYYYGPGIINAYHLENTAVFPRIIIDDIFMELLKEYSDDSLKLENHEKELMKQLMKSDYEERAEIRKIWKSISPDDDGKYFLDYLRIMKHEYADEYSIMTFLKQHKKIIEEGINKYKSDNHVLEKYLWLKKYHNKTLYRMYDDYFERKNELAECFLF